MRIHNLYTDAKGESHFRDIEIEWIEERRGSKLSKRLPANGVIFRETQAEHNLDWHPAPRRQYIVNLDAGVKITASDGENVDRLAERAGRMDHGAIDPGRGHLGQRIIDRIGRDLAMVRAHLAVLPDVDLGIDDQHGFLLMTTGHDRARPGHRCWPATRSG